MTNIATALSYFWNGFGIPAFVEGTVPDKMPEELSVRNIDGTPVIFERDAPVKMPYITYRLAQPEWDEPMSMYARVWYRGTSFKGLASKIDQISDALKSGYSVSDDGFYMALMKDSNFCQYMPDDSGDGMIKTAYLSLIMHVVEV